MQTKHATQNRIHLRQLCSSGLSSRIIMPDLLKTLKGVIEHQSALFMWFDKNCGMRDMYIDILLPDVLDFYFKEYHNLYTPYGPDLCLVARTGKSAGNYRQVPKEFYKTDMFNLVCRPHKHHFMLDGIVRNNGRSVGGVMLTREKGQRPFSQNEEETLQSMLPFLQHALTHPPETTTYSRFINDDSSGLIIASKRGKISHINQAAREILFWACQQSMQFGSRLVNMMDVLQDPVKQLCNRLSNISRGKPGFPPALKINGRFGPIVLRAYRLDSVDDSSDDVVNIHITQQKPVELDIIQRVHGMSLSPRQKEVVMWTAMGYSSQAISDKMKISATTYRDHVSKLYEKLNIHSREELLRKLALDKHDS